MLIEDADGFKGKDGIQSCTCVSHEQLIGADAEGDARAAHGIAGNVQDAFGNNRNAHFQWCGDHHDQDLRQGDQEDEGISLLLRSVSF